MPELHLCEICGDRCETLPNDGGDIVHQKCPICGEFILTGTAVSMNRAERSEETMRRLQGSILDQNRAGAIPAIDSNELERLRRRPLPGLVERADRLLQDAVTGSSSLRKKIDWKGREHIGRTYSLNGTDVAILSHFLQEEGYIYLDPNGSTGYVKPKGLIRVEELQRTPNETSNIGFVAMWFNEELSDAHTIGLQPGIANAGYDPLRIDQKEHVNKIDDEIIAGINMSRFLVADFTGHRGGVYFEAGYAMGKGLPVVWSCRKSDIDDLHFDIRQYNCIDWDTPEDLSRRLQNRIEAVIGRGQNPKADTTN